MIIEKNKSIKEFSEKFEEDYNLIMKNSEKSYVSQEWQCPGDSFEIFTLYNDKTPVVASCNTTLVNY